MEYFSIQVIFMSGLCAIIVIFLENVACGQPKWRNLFLETQ